MILLTEEEKRPSIYIGDGDDGDEDDGGDDDDHEDDNGVDDVSDEDDPKVKRSKMVFSQKKGFGALGIKTEATKKAFSLKVKSPKIYLTFL